MQKVSLKKGVKTYKDDSIKRLKDAKRIQAVLLECIVDNDLDAFREILQGHINAVNAQEFCEEAGIARRTLYKMLEPDSNPTFKNLAKVIGQISA